MVVAMVTEAVRPSGECFLIVGAAQPDRPPQHAVRPLEKDTELSGRWLKVAWMWLFKPRSHSHIKPAQLV